MFRATALDAAGRRHGPVLGGDPAIRLDEAEAVS
jgi:hypothetical protein